jgi:hypothetical protein
LPARIVVILAVLQHGGVNHRDGQADLSRVSGLLRSSLRRRPTLHEPRERNPYALDHVVPDPGAILPQQPRGRVPGGIAAAVWGMRANWRWVVNVAAVFGAIQLYTQWFDALGPGPLAFIVGGLLLLAFAYGLWALNRHFTGKVVNSACAVRARLR